MGYLIDQWPHALTRLPDCIDPETLAHVPAVTAVALQALPLERRNGTLRVAMCGPVDWDRLQQIRVLTGLRVQAVVIDSAMLQEGLRRFYPDDTTDTTHVKDTAIDLSASGETGATPVARMVDQLIATAVRRRASDIHLEPFERELSLRYRIDGFLQTQTPLPWALRAAIVSRIKVLADLNIAEKRRPQDGKIRTKVEGRDIDLRVSTTPTIHGEKVVLRILDREAVAVDLAGLGIAPDVCAQLKQAIARPYGLTLVTGPTGSGKTTTLYAALNHIRAEGTNILTIEDPIEYSLPGINQTQVHPEIGLTFAHALRSFLRQDPDVILVGEIRDGETAAVAIQAALTGHLVLSSVHTNDAPGAVGRLVDMGVEPFLVASSLSLAMAQRLVRRNCSACARTVEPTTEAMEQLALRERQTWQGAGCPQCAHTGYKGRIALTEIMPISQEIAAMITRRAPTQDIRRQAITEGMRTLREDGVQKLMDGITSPSEVMRETTAE